VVSWKEDFQKDLQVYEFNAVLPGSGRTVSFKPITTKMMKKLLIYENERDQGVVEAAFDELLRLCVVDEDFDPMEQYMQDRFFLLLNIRMKSKGEKIQRHVACDRCKGQYVQTVHLSDVGMKPMKEDVDWVIRLTPSISIEVDFIRRRNQKEALDSALAGKYDSDLQRDADVVLGTLASSIKAIITTQGREDDVTFSDKMYLIDNVPEEGLERIKDWHEENNFGVDIRYSYSCPHCKECRTHEISFHDMF
jgi:hypothetical protein